MDMSTPENEALHLEIDRDTLTSQVKEGLYGHPQPKPPAPPAWAMMPPSNSLQLLDETFSVSGTELSATKQH